MALWAARHGRFGPKPGVTEAERAAGPSGADPAPADPAPADPAPADPAPADDRAGAHRTSGGGARGGRDAAPGRLDAGPDAGSDAGPGRRSGAEAEAGPGVTEPPGTGR
jgi:hypothetical protein